MTKRLSACSLWGAVGWLALGLCGCGGGGPAPDRPEIAAKSDVEHFGGVIKNQIYEFRAKVKKRGAAAAKQELPMLMETFQGYETQQLGEHAATYKEIHDKLKAMESSLGNTQAVVKAAEELGTLADKLPGTGNPNPVVE